MTTAKTGTKTQIKKVAKPKADAKKTLDKTNKKVTAQKVIIHRELKYIYPRGCKETVKRKAFRKKVRNTLRKFGRDIAKLKGQDKKVLQEKFNAYTTEHVC